MHTIIVIAIGFVLLAICTLVGKFTGSPGAMSTAALIFLPLWAVGAGINLYLGVKTAGYTVADEAPIFALVFSVPAAVALVLWWLLR